MKATLHLLHLLLVPVVSPVAAAWRLAIATPDVYVDRPGLKTQDLSVREGGKPRTVDRIIPAADAALRIALVFDASSSMGEHMLDVQEAALRFVETNIEERDRVMMVAFNGAVRILWPTNLREQSLVIYRTEPAGSDWRPLEVSLKGGGRLRAPSSIYVASEAGEAP